MTEEEKKARIAALNDALRFRGIIPNGKIVLTGDLAYETDDAEKMTKIIKALRSFNDFNEDNDPHGEHDCAKFTVDGEEFMFKVDYYALDEEALSEHPEDPNVTIRVMSVFYSRDY
ncbi:DUF3768 domain-containing protein [Rhizobium leguminosarum bv. viciae]|uniref:DUF3768 domain-containing protein n=1 Tax=Rhizobium leguminosarum TaxID=384 RepID=UPI001441DA09|nr:DUF3768 domain-containing protein [Rhizobium leguminosarum]NKL08383.1 DUF3768 domain-containing protein [Rhizobium leguminosarum bv. viciae]